MRPPISINLSASSISPNCLMSLASFTVMRIRLVLFSMPDFVSSYHSAFWPLSRSSQSERTFLSFRRARISKTAHPRISSNAGMIRRIIAQIYLGPNQQSNHKERGVQAAHQRSCRLTECHRHSKSESQRELREQESDEEQFVSAVNVKPIEQDGACEHEEQETICLHDLRVHI